MTFGLSNSHMSPANSPYGLRYVLDLNLEPLVFMGATYRRGVPQAEDDSPWSPFIRRALSL